LQSGASYVVSPALGFTLALTIALHNIPEGIAVAPMLYIILGELIPGSQNAGNSHAGTFGTVFGKVAVILLLSVI